MSPVSELDLDGYEAHDVPSGGRSGYLRADDRQVHYLEWGPSAAPTVLALHGGGQTAYMYEELGRSLAERYHVLAPDLPGHGDSDRLPDMRRFGRYELADSVIPFLDAFGIDRTVIVGASLGGLTAITLAAKYPAYVAAIALIDVGHQLEDEGVRRIIGFMRKHESFASLDEAAEAVAEYLPHRKPVKPDNLKRNLRRRPDGRWTWKHAFGSDPEMRKIADERVQDWRQILVGLDDDARAVQVPSLVLRGSRSDVLSDEGANEVTNLLPKARLEVIDAAGHLAAGDNPHGTVALVSDFLREIDW